MQAPHRSAIWQFGEHSEGGWGLALNAVPLSSQSWRYQPGAIPALLQESLKSLLRRWSCGWGAHNAHTAALLLYKAMLMETNPGFFPKQLFGA